MGLLPCILRSLTAFLLSGNEKEGELDGSTDLTRLPVNESAMIIADVKDEDKIDTSIYIDEKYEDTLLWTESILWLTMVLLD